VEYTTIFLFDQFTDNKKDVKNKGYLLTAFIRGSNLIKNPDYKLEAGVLNTLDPDDATTIDVDTITTFYEHEGQIFIGSQRKGTEMENYMCLTRIIFPENIMSIYKVHSSTGYICAETKGGSFFGMSNGNELVHLYDDTP
jgi:hypothetical protein